MSSCSRHASKEAVGACINCGELVCAGCHKEVEGKSYCQVCAEKLFTTAEVKSEQTSVPVPAAAKPAPLSAEKDKVGAAPAVKAAQAVESMTLQGKPASELEKTMIVQPGVTQPVSNLWWLLPVFLAWVGGLAAWLVVKDKAPKKARNMLYTGLGMTVIQGIIVFGLIFALVLSPVVKTVISSTAKSPGTGTDHTSSTAGAKDSSETVKNWNSGKMSTGQTVQLASATIEPAGGSVTVDKPGDELNGLQISVPEGAYRDSRPFTIYSSPIIGNTFPGLKPISPLISIDNGGDLAGKLMTVKIPVRMPEGGYAAAFTIDEKNKRLQALPTLASDQESITVGAMHFSDIVVGASLPITGPIDTGFTPGVDDWPMPNNRSYLTPDGECNGMCISALWYYWSVVLPLQGQAPRLHSLLDNNGIEPQTPGFWLDDSRAYRFVCVVQEDFFADGYIRQYCPMVDDSVVWKNLITAMETDHEPQLLIVEKSTANYGHALIAYWLEQTDVNNGIVKVADPNLAGNTEKVIKYVNGRFEPYKAGLTSDVPDAYILEEVHFANKASVMEWAGVEEKWKQVGDGTIGSIPTGDKKKFPGYSLTIADSKGNKQPLEGGLKAEDKLFSIIVESPDNAQLDTEVYRDEQPVEANGSQQYELKPGKNHLGIYIKGKGDIPYYVDFKYVDIQYGEAAVKIIPPDQPGCIYAPLKFSLQPSGMPDGVRYEWTFEGDATYTGMTATHSFKSAGSASVAVVAISTKDEKPVARDDMQFSVKDFDFKIVANPDSGRSGQSASFSVEGACIPPGTDFKWLFGDGKGSTGDSVSHTYADAGSYAVAAKATFDVEGEGQARALTRQLTYKVDSSGSVTIVLPPAIEDGRGVVKVKYFFTLLTKGMPSKTEYSWYVNDRPAGKGETGALTFSKVTTYTVTVRADWTDNSGQAREITTSKNFDIGPEPSLSISPLNGTSGETGKSYKFQASPEGIPGEARYTWYVNDKQSGTGDENTPYTLKPPDAKLYNIKLVAAWETNGVKQTVNAEIKFTATAPSSTLSGSDTDAAATPGGGSGSTTTSGGLQACTICNGAPTGYVIYVSLWDGKSGQKTGYLQGGACQKMTLSPGHYRADVYWIKSLGVGEMTARQGSYVTAIDVVAGGSNKFPFGAQ